MIRAPPCPQRLGELPAETTRGNSASTSSPIRSKEVFKAFGPQGDAAVQAGCARRTATMLGGDGPRLRMAWSLVSRCRGRRDLPPGRRDPDGREPLRSPTRLTSGADAMVGRRRGLLEAPARKLVRPMRTAASAPSSQRGPTARRRLALSFLERLIRAERAAEVGWGSSTPRSGPRQGSCSPTAAWQGSSGGGAQAVRAPGRAPLSTSASRRANRCDRRSAREHLKLNP